MSGPDAGLCCTCAGARLQRTARGSEFWRCLRAEDDPRFPRYPALPVLACPGYERRAPGEQGHASRSRSR